MLRTTLVGFVAIIVSAFSTGLSVSPASAGGFLEEQSRIKRVQDARSARGRAVEQAFVLAGAAWPPRGVFVRAFKLEGVVELWAAPRRGKRWVKVQRFPVCAASGVLGPKRRVGDLQVPEGFYHIDRFNPWSRYHLSLGLNYPNRVDLKRPRKAAPGGDIFIHGACVTIGCLPLTDALIRDLYLAAIHARDQGQRRIPVHVFPCRFGGSRCEAALTRAGRLDPRLRPFWTQLLPGYRAFERDRVPPRVTATRAGRYVVTRARGAAQP